MRESKILQKVKKLLDQNNIMYERLQTTGIITDSGIMNDLTALGRPDILIFKDGKAYAVETKSNIGRQRVGQELWQKRALKNDIPYFLIRAIDDIQILAKELKLPYND